MEFQIDVEFNCQNHLRFASRKKGTLKTKVTFITLSPTQGATAAAAAFAVEQTYTFESRWANNNDDNKNRKCN